MASVAMYIRISYCVISTFGIHQKGKKQDTHEGEGSDCRRS